MLPAITAAAMPAPMPQPHRASARSAEVVMMASARTADAVRLVRFRRFIISSQDCPRVDVTRARFVEQSDYGCCSQFSAQVSKLTTHERRLRRRAFGCQEDPGNPQRVQFRTKLLSVFVEVGGDKCAVYLLLVNQEGCSGDTDDMHGRAGFNQTRAQVRDIRRFADDQNCGAFEI